MKYRPEIDGLRAVAVVPVVLFHGGFSAFSGGYIGVDVFFVISGYLITTIIVDAIEAGSFTILEFYERRARRILPALIAVIVVTTIVGWFLMLPEEFRNYGRSLVSVGLFLSNVFFWRQSGYFESGAEEKPMLHTWSLAVEEQFYIVFPLLLVVLYRFKHRVSLIKVISVLGLGSLLLCEAMSHISAEANYFLFPFRAWELFAGALCALLLRQNPVFFQRRGREGLAALGLMIVCACVFIFSPETRFPSVYTLLPIGGTMLLILFAGDGNGLVTRTLSLKGVVGIGLISYSAYLWHQPIFALARIYSVDGPGMAMMAVLIALTFLLAYLSWLYVEMPFRSRAFTERFKPSRTVIGATGTLVLLCAVGVTLASPVATSYSGFYKRDQFDLVAFAIGDTNKHRKDCHYLPRFYFSSLPEHLPRKTCIFGPDDETAPRVAIVGDSHADAIAQPLIEILQSSDITVAQMTLSGCAFIEGYVRATKDCDGANKRIWSALKDFDPDVVIIAGQWISLFTPNAFDNGKGGISPFDFRNVEFLGDKNIKPADRAKHARELVLNGVRRVLDNGIATLLVYPVPEPGWNVPSRFGREMRYFGKIPKSISIGRMLYEARQKDVIATLDQIESDHVARVRPSEYICEGDAAEGHCYQSRNSKIYYSDDSHLTNTAAAMFAAEVLQKVKELLRGLGKSSEGLAS
ncbi:acyltransferase family protein [uncultured Roseibium sp.]|uniref:acyltransferase family protein n=1 Tax=uncultured Roseibium sp. TaxID=1936171 RepID=UPI002591F0AF|nr:acyltransferase family protein [uncultured Roseibium sp.]